MRQLHAATPELFRVVRKAVYTDGREDASYYGPYTTEGAAQGAIAVLSRYMPWQAVSCTYTIERAITRWKTVA